MVMNSPTFVKMLILAFKITCILRSAIDRYILGAFGEDSLVPSCTYIITCITLMFLRDVNHVKLLLLMQWLLYFDYYTAYVVIIDMTSSTPEHFRRSGFGVWQIGIRALVYSELSISTDKRYTTINTMGLKCSE